MDPLVLPTTYTSPLTLFTCTTSQSSSAELPRCADHVSSRSALNLIKRTSEPPFLLFDGQVPSVLPPKYNSFDPWCQRL